MGEAATVLRQRMIICAAVVGVIASVFARSAAHGATRAGAFRLTSTHFADGQWIPAAEALDRMGKTDCGGKNVSPPLQWSGVPATTHSLALILHDPDAKRADGWTHWVIYGMAPTLTGLRENGGHGNGPFVQGKSSFGIGDYAGPCPPVGDPPHHYRFTLYALDLSATAMEAGLDRPKLLAAMSGHIVDSAVLIGLYQRK